MATTLVSSVELELGWEFIVVNEVVQVSVLVDFNALWARAIGFQVQVLRFGEMLWLQRRCFCAQIFDGGGKPAAKSGTFRPLCRGKTRASPPTHRVPRSLHSQSLLTVPAHYCRKGVSRLRPRFNSPGGCQIPYTLGLFPKESAERGPTSPPLGGRGRVSSADTIIPCTDLR